MAMYDWVPYLEGKYLSYYQWFAFIAGFVMLVLSLLSFLAYLVLCYLAQAAKQSLPFLNTLKSITFNGGFIFLAIIPLVCSAVDTIYLVEGMLGMMLILTGMILIDNGRRNWQPKQLQQSISIQTTIQMQSLRTELSTQHNKPIINNNRSQQAHSFLKKSLNLDRTVKKRLIIATIVSIVFPLLLYKTCLCFYNVQIGYYNNLLGFGINTYLTRIFQLKPSCPIGPPCQLYATIPEDPSYAFFLNLHTHHSVDNVTIFYQQLDTIDPTVFINLTAESYDYLGLEFMAARKVHSALITGLKPDTRYLTKVFYNNQFWANAIYKTLPNNNSRPIRMINGGDSGYTQAAINLTKLATQLQPDIFFMGGDVAYDDNMPACAYTWDYYLNMYGRLTSTLGYLMPMVLTVGNHDVGLNELPGINITVNNYGPAFFLYFPQHYDRNLDGHIIKRVPPINHRRTILNFTFANVHYLCLDSGYMHHFEGYQKSFLIDSLNSNKGKLKFVNYHVPIYSVCEAFDRDPARYLYALFHWVPNFDKFKVMTVFENHVHSFKRTKPLIGNQPTQNGTVYLGDGSYGALISQMCTPDITVDIFDAFSKSNNMWVSDIYQDRVEHVAYNSLGVVIDKFTQWADSYKLA